MPHSYCPRGVLPSECSTVQPLKLPYLRVFISIITTKFVKAETRICNTCYNCSYTWKNDYPDFGRILARIELELSNNEVVVDGKSLIDSEFIHKSDM